MHSLSLALTPMQQPAPLPPTPPALPTVGPLPATADVAALQGQLAELAVQRAGLRAQSDGLRRQLENMLQTNPARPGVQQEWADVGSQLAKVEGQMAALEARISQKEGVPVTVPGTRMPPMQRGPDPDLAVAGGIAVMLALVLPLSIAWAIRMLRRTPQRMGPRTEDFSPRFDRLEHAVDAIAIEVERVSEGQRFVTKILAERGVNGAGSVSSNEPLALGAGAAEPVRVQEREGVRQTR